MVSTAGWWLPGTGVRWPACWPPWRTITPAPSTAGVGGCRRRAPWTRSPRTTSGCTRHEPGRAPPGDADLAALRGAGRVLVWSDPVEQRRLAWYAAVARQLGEPEVERLKTVSNEEW